MSHISHLSLVESCCSVLENVEGINSAFKCVVQPDVTLKFYAFRLQTTLRAHRSTHEIAAILTTRLYKTNPYLFCPNSGMILLLLLSPTRFCLPAHKIYCITLFVATKVIAICSVFCSLTLFLLFRSTKTITTTTKVFLVFREFR